MPVKERSFRIGCGRYIQEENIIDHCGREIARLGKAPLIIGGVTALSITASRIEKSVKAECRDYSIERYVGTCNDDAARKFAEAARDGGFDVIVGVGGGVIMDLAKLVGHFSSLPVVNIPTSSATCAAYTPLSVRYTPDGRTVGTMHFEGEVNAVLVDKTIIAAQPTRLLLAGVFDALAKFIEIKHRFSVGSASFPLGLDWAYVLSVHSYGELCELTEDYISLSRTAPECEVVDRVIFTLIAATGVISGIARGSNQTALAHKFYEMTRVLFPDESRKFLHGELVGIGLLLQNHFNGEADKSKILLDMMKKHGMPMCISDLGIAPSEENVVKYYEKMKSSSAVIEGGEDALRRLEDSLNYLKELG